MQEYATSHFIVGHKTISECIYLTWRDTACRWWRRWLKIRHFDELLWIHWHMSRFPSQNTEVLVPQALTLEATYETTAIWLAYDMIRSFISNGTLHTEDDTTATCSRLAATTRWRLIIMCVYRLVVNI